MKEMLVPAALFLVLASASSLRAETKMCVPSDPDDPVFIISKFETESPVLAIQFGNGQSPRNLPCVAGAPGLVFDCEQAAGTDGIMRYFEFIGGQGRADQMRVEIHMVRTRNPPVHGVQHLVRSGPAVDYHCRKSNLSGQ